MYCNVSPYFTLLRALSGLIRLLHASCVVFLTHQVALLNVNGPSLLSYCLTPEWPDGCLSRPRGVLGIQWFNFCLTCFHTLIEHKQSSKYIYHFIADSNVTYQELEQNKKSPTVTYYVLYLTRYKKLSLFWLVHSDSYIMILMVYNVVLGFVV